MPCIDLDIKIIQLNFSKFPTGGDVTRSLGVVGIVVVGSICDLRADRLTLLPVFFFFFGFLHVNRNVTFLLSALITMPVPCHHTSSLCWILTPLY